MKTVAAGGFKDITRIASSSPEVWQQICLSNQKQLSNVLDSYIRLLVQAKYLVDNKKGHELYNMFESSREYRNSMEDSSYGPTKKEYVVYATCSMKPAESQPLQQFLPSTRSVLKISALRITASSKRVLSALNFMKSRQAFLPGRS